MTEMSSAAGPAAPETSRSSGLSATQQADLAEFSRLRGWTQALVALRLGGPDGGESDLLGFHDHSSTTLDLTHAHPSGLAMLLAGRPSRLSDLVREPGALADARRRARAVRSTAARLRRLHGVEAEILAIGTAGWGEDPARRTYAPVLLRGARLHARGHGEEDFDLDLAPATRLNPVLVDYLRIEFGVPLDPHLIDELAAGAGGFDPQLMLEALVETCADIPGFSVEPRQIIGVFPDVVPAMVADLELRGTRLLRHPTLRILTQPLADTAPAKPALSGQAPVVLDADADQQAAVDAILAGARVAVHAPAGSGATQLLADAIAGLAAAGQRVLLLSPYVDELADIQHRLGEVGLDHLVLDLSADPYDAAQIAERLLVAVEAAGAASSAGSAKSAPAEASTDATPDPELGAPSVGSAELLAHVETMHRLHEPWGVSAYAAQVALAELTALRPAPRSRVRLRADVLQRLGPERLAALRAQLEEAAAIGAFRRQPAVDPWYGARITSRLEGDLALVHVRALADGELTATRALLDAALAEAGMPAANRFSDYSAGLRLLDMVRETLETFRPEAWDTSVGEAVAATATREWRAANGVRIGAAARRRIIARTRRLLRPGVPPADLHAALLQLHQQREAWDQFVGAGARPAIPLAYDDVVAAHGRVIERFEWLRPRLATIAGGGDLASVPLNALQEKLAGLSERAESLAIRPKVVTLLDDLHGAGLGELVEDLATRTVAPDLVGSELSLVWWASVLSRIGSLDPGYSGHDGAALRAAVTRFTLADNVFRASQTTRLRAEMTERIRATAAAHPGQVAELRAWASVSPGEHGGALLARPRVAMPLARLLTRCADLVTAISPCWSMSPLLTNSVLPPDVSFDVVIVAQGQSVDLAQTASAISRGSSLVVVGDPQLAPEAGRESLAQLALSRLPSFRLRSTYRPASPQLAVVAAAVSAHLGEPRPAVEVGSTRAADHRRVRLDRVTGVGVLAPGTTVIESTAEEVEHVARIVMHHALNFPEQSLAVVALSRLHADRIRDAVRLERGVHPRVLEFFQPNLPEPFIVVDAADCGALVRDVVVLAVGFGRTPHGRVLHQFGAIGEAGGAELLLAAVTRARLALRVVSALGSEELDPARLRQPGARALRDLLATAEAGGVPQPTTEPQPVDLVAREAGRDSGTSGTAAAPVPVAVQGTAAPAQVDALLDDFARRLGAEGLDVERCVPVGSGAPEPTEMAPIEIAVRDQLSGRRLAVESDGPAYAAQGSVRERDRLRAEQLARLGWQHVRVWSIDVFRDPAREVARVRRALLPDDGAMASDEKQLTPPEREDLAHDPAPDQARDLAQTKDDTDVGWGDVPPGNDAHDEWLRQQRPPHWG